MKLNRKTARLASLLLVTTGAATIAMAAPAAGAGYIDTEGPLVDYGLSRSDPTDGAWARVISYGSEETGTFVYFIVTGLDTDAAGTTLGAHVHSGPCFEGQPTASGPHYNIGGPADEEHEIWLDFRIRGNGIGIGRAHVDFAIPDGDAQSVVIHEMATQPGGAAGGRLACLPVEF